MSSTLETKDAMFYQTNLFGFYSVIIKAGLSVVLGISKYSHYISRQGVL